MPYLNRKFKDNMDATRHVHYVYLRIINHVYVRQQLWSYVDTAMASLIHAVYHYTRSAAVDVGNLMLNTVAKSIYLLIKYSCLNFSS